MTFLYQQMKEVFGTNTFTFDENISRVYYNGNSSYPSFWVLGTGGQILTSTDRETWSDPFRVQRSINQWAPSGDLAASPDGRIRLFVSPIGILYHNKWWGFMVISF